MPKSEVYEYKSLYSNKATKFDTHNVVAGYLGSGNKIFDVGCNEGHLLTLNPNNEYYGIDISKSSIDRAKEKGYKFAEFCDLNDLKSIEDLFSEKQKFDRIVFGAVLEHIFYPEKVLTYFATKHLEKNGEVIVTLPNVAHLFIRIGLLFGQFNYKDDGILDKTHLHLYTLKTARALIENSGLNILEERFGANRLGPIANLHSELGKLFGPILIFRCGKK